MAMGEGEEEGVMEEGASEGAGEGASEGASEGACEGGSEGASEGLTETESGPSDNAASDRKAFASVSWVLTDEDLDVQTELALGFLDYLMTGTAASPLVRTREGGWV